MRFDSFSIHLRVWLRSGRISILHSTDIRANRSVTHLDPALIGKMMHDCVGDVMRDIPALLLERGWDWGQDVDSYRRSLFDPDMEAEVVGASSQGNMARTAALLMPHSDGHEIRFSGVSPHTARVEDSHRFHSSTILSSLSPTCPSEEFFTKGDPLLIAPWRDPEMLGHAVLTMLKMAGPPLNKGMTSVFDSPTGKRRTALHRAASEGRLDALPPGRRGRRSIDPADTLGATPLMVAAANGHNEFVARLVEMGADPDLRDSEGRAALHAASEKGDDPVVRTLIESGARVDVADSRGDTPLHLAAANGHVGAAKLQVTAGASADVSDTVYSSTPLHRAARGGHAAMVPVLIAAGADVNAPNEGGRTPLHLAASYGHAEMTSALIDIGADVNRRDHRGETPLRLPSFFQHLDCVAALIEGGADVTASDRDGNTPLHVAASMNRNLAAGLLLDGGADVEAMNGEGLTPLDLAIVNGHPAGNPLSHVEYVYAMDDEHNSEVAEVLIERGASIVPERIPVGDRHILWPHLTPAELLRDSGDIDYYLLPLSDLNRTLRRALPGYGSWDGPNQPLSGAALSISLLHDAAFKGVPVVVEALLKSGASPTTAVRCAGTPLHFAAAQGNVDIASMLLGRGADIDMPRGNATGGWYPCNAVDSSSAPALMDAITMGQAEMTRFLLDRGATFERYVLGPSDLTYILDNSCPPERREAMAEVLTEFGMID